MLARFCGIMLSLRAHEVELLKQGYEAFTCTGDCYRRDTIDNRHYPVFTQMEAMRLFDVFFEREKVSSRSPQVQRTS